MRGDVGTEDTLARARMALEQSVEGIPQNVLTGLRDGRIKALELAEKRENKFLRFPRWVTAGGVATLAILVVAVSLWLSPMSTQSTLKGDYDLDIVASGEQLDLYEDLDFFLWLEERGNEH
jgi:hypothetical protein